MFFCIFSEKSTSTRKAISLTLIIVTASIFQGLTVVQVYAEPLFEEVIPNMSPNLGSILLAVVGIVAGVVAACLTEIAGRRVRSLDCMLPWYFLQERGVYC